MASLYTIHRPKNFDELLGQDQVVSILKAELAQGITSHAYIFIGPRGTGKTTTARILAKAINCENLHKDGSPCNECLSCKLFIENKAIDLIEIDAASNRGIDEIRAIKEKIEFKPTQVKKKVYIIDEVHMLTKEAFNALLKTLEEPPEHVMFILATTEPHKIPVTIFSRCERIEFRLATEKELADLLEKVAKASEIKYESKAIELLASLAAGSYRDGLSLLDTLLAKARTENGLTYDLVFTTLGLPDYRLVENFCDAIQNDHATEAFEQYNQSKEKNVHVSQFFKSVILEFKKRLVTEKDAQRSQKLVKTMAIFFEAYTQLKNSFDSDIQVEMAIFQSTSGVVAQSAPQKSENPLPQDKPKDNPIQESTTEPKPNPVLTEKIDPPAEVVEKNEEQPKKKLKKKAKKKEEVAPEFPLEREENPVTTTSFIPDLTLEFVLSLWSMCLKTVQSKHNHLYAMLMTSKPNAIFKDDVLGVHRLEIKVKYDFHKKTIESPASKTIIQTVLSDVFMTPVQVVCIVDRQMVTERMVISESKKQEEIKKDPEMADVFDELMEGDVEQLV